ncbi:MAG: FkbM family methyltransferase [Hassallia sp. WJT32-NPBG1]|jgi:FkbM family methyltransferase|nr:FkbM family methyltransferase [Hassallia sp. WJT32-NPBG1]
MLDWRLAQEVGYYKFLYRYPIRQICKRILRIDNTIKLNNGIVMELPRNSRFGTEVFLNNGSVDWGSEEYLIQHLEENKIFLDVGANIGYYSLLAAPYCRSVYAFEPDPRSITALQKNALKVDNIIIVQEALYSEVGEMQFNIAGPPEFSHLKKTSETVDCVNVKVNTLDNFALVNAQLKVTAIKTDVEGADFDVLLGARNLITRDQPLILSEVYPDKRLFKYLETLNYLVFAFVKPKKKSLTHLKAKFVQITEQPKNVRPKMIFLVPNRLRQSFLNLVQ